MLSIGKVAPGRAAYYEKTVAKGRDDYYSGAGEAPGTWVGTGAAGLGLSGPVEAEQFNAMIAGLDPSDPDIRRMLLSSERKARTINGKRHDPVAAYDLTFSAPKSVSVLFATADLDIARELVTAHDEAVRAALGYIEDRAVYTRRGRNGVVVERGAGLVAAAYRHRMSRAKDPQLHTHVVAGNLVRTPADGKWRALHATVLYRHARTAGVLYQAHLRAEIRDRLGLEWGPVSKGAAELEIVPKPVLREFSRRRAEIEEAAAEAGGLPLARKAGAEALALLTRAKKDLSVRTADWRADIASRAAEHGWSRRDITKAIDRVRARNDHMARGIDATTRRSGTPRPGGSPTDDLAQEFAGPKGLTSMQNAFAERDALTAVAEHSRDGISVADARAFTAAFLERADVLDVTGTNAAGVHEQRHTTGDLVACEHRIVAIATARADTDCAVVNARAIDRALMRSVVPLSPQQEQVLRSVTRSGNGIDVIEALAGTGKTFTAGKLRDVYATANIPVIGLAPTGRAARELAEVGIPSQTIHRWIDGQLRFPEARLPRGAVVILDEAGMAPTRLTEALLQRVAEADAKLIAIGDSGQLPSVSAGGWLAAVGDRVGRHRLDEVRRQRDPEERRMLGLLHDADDGGPAYLDWLDGRDRLHISTGTATLLHGALDAWNVAREQHGLENVALIARDAETRSVLNTRARAIRKAAGSLTEERSYGGTRVAQGDRIITRRNDYGLDIDNGTRGTVTKTSASGVTLTTDVGHHRQLPAAYVAEHVEHAYALTGHGMQGATVDWAAVVARPDHLTHGWAYTALSRARTETHLFVPAIDHARREERADIAPHDTTSTPERDDTILQIQRRLTVRDDEDLAIEQLMLPHRTDPQTPAAELPVPDEGPPRTETRLERLVRLGDALAALRSERDPQVAAWLSQLDDIGRDRTKTATHLARLEHRKVELPEPQRRSSWRTGDPASVERASLKNAIAAANDHLEALAGRTSRVRTRLGPGIDDTRRAYRDLEHRLEAAAGTYRRAQSEITRALGGHERPAAVGQPAVEEGRRSSQDRAGTLAVLDDQELLRDLVRQHPGEASQLDAVADLATRGLDGTGIDPPELG